MCGHKKWGDYFDSNDYNTYPVWLKMRLEPGKTSPNRGIPLGSQTLNIFTHPVFFIPYKP